MYIYKFLDVYLNVIHLSLSKDTDPNKINLSVGAYRDNEGKPYMLDVVKRAEELLVKDTKRNKEYLGIDGHAGFRKVSQELIFGQEAKSLREGRVCTAQCLSGTGSLRVGFEFLAQFFPRRTCVYSSNPTWGNQNTVASKAGFQFKSYRYWDAKRRGLDFDGMVQDIQAAPSGSIILLHACAHNPTGIDPSPQQWQTLAKVIRERNHFPFFDAAYQGFATGDLDNDASAIRMFEGLGFQMLVAQSYAKNFGLYGERAGCVHIVAPSAESAKNLSSHLKRIIRPMYSNPPKHGAEIVTLVLKTPELFKRWKEEIKIMSSRIIAMRKALRDELVRLKTPGNWDHIVSQIGMFSFTGLNRKQCELLINEHHVYLLYNGRISMAGLNTSNVARFAKAVDAVVRATA
uniref:Aspartate aminotransferase n=1 Tax=Lotharella globosa TaxID=91324 RepID=A0A7S3YMT3_9EUKA